MKHLILMLCMATILVSCSKEDDNVNITTNESENSNSKEEGDASAVINIKEIYFSNGQNHNLTLTTNYHSKSFGATIEDKVLSVVVEEDDFKLTLAWETDKEPFVASTYAEGSSASGTKIWGTLLYEDSEYRGFSEIELRFNSIPKLGKFFEIDLTKLVVSITKPSGYGNIKNVTGKIKVQVVKDDGSLVVAE